MERSVRGYAGYAQVAVTVKLRKSEKRRLWLRAKSGETRSACSVQRGPRPRRLRVSEGVRCPGVVDPVLGLPLR